MREESRSVIRNKLPCCHEGKEEAWAKQVRWRGLHLACSCSTGQNCSPCIVGDPVIESEGELEAEDKPLGKASCNWLSKEQAQELP